MSVNLAFLNNREDVFIARTMLEACQGWQEMLDGAPTIKEKRKAVAEALAAIQAMNRFDGSRALIAKSELGWVMPPQEPSEDSVEVIEFNDLLIRGWLGRISYMAVEGNGLITWPVFQAKVINPDEREVVAADFETDPDEDAIHMPTDEVQAPILLPVRHINYALWTSDSYPS
jgi:hypothetical protein